MEVINTNNIDVLNTYINLKKNNMPTDTFIKHANKIRFIESSEINNEGEYDIYSKEILYQPGSYNEVIMHELMHSATINYKVIKKVKNNKPVFGKYSSARIILFGKLIGSALDEGIIELLTILTNIDSLNQYDYSKTYQKLTSIATLLISVIGKEEFINSYFSSNPINFYKLLIQKIGLKNTINLIKTTDKYIYSLDTNNQDYIDEIENELNLIKIELGKIIKNKNKSTEEIKLVRKYYRDNYSRK